MLNLSDKELDRLGKEAAQEYEPGDVLGSQSWERLELRLDKGTGNVSPNPLRHVRRFPFYYAPAALLVVMGVSYFLVKQGNRRSGSPPAAAAQVQTGKSSSSSINQESQDKSTSTPTASTTDESRPSRQGGADSMGASNNGATASGTNSANAASGRSGAGASANGAGTGPTARDRVAGVGTGSATGNRAAGAGTNGDKAAGASSAAGNHAAGSGSSAAGLGAGTGSTTSGAVATTGNTNNTTGRHGHRYHTGTRILHDGSARSGQGVPPDEVAGNRAASSGADATGDRSAGSGVNVAGSGAASARTHELGLSTIQGLRPTKRAASVNDSALRAFTIKSNAPQLIHKNGLHINRSLQFGLVVAPDFASVNSLAGDKPGSVIGVTVDYQIGSRWYIGTGLLLDRKNYASRPQDFHAPMAFFRANNMNMQHLAFVKGTMEMLEIPLNLRYDFSVAGSTLFFANAGVSSYLLTSETNNYYSNTYGREVCQSFPVSGDRSYLLSSLNLSLGVETGLSNSLSLMVAPYVKMPIRNIGFGQMPLSSVGINFALKFAPVISRKRY